MQLLAGTYCLRVGGEVSTHIAFFAFNGEPFGELIDARPIERHLHNRLMTRRIKDKLALPILLGPHGDSEHVTFLHRSEDNIFPPGPDRKALRFPQAVHNCSSGEVAVPVPSFDDAVRSLLVPHYAGLAIEPLHGGRYWFAVVEIDGAFDRIGVAVGATSFPFVVTIVLVEVAEGIYDYLAVALGFID